jgi:hypothetical protein
MEELLAEMRGGPATGAAGAAGSGGRRMSAGESGAGAGAVRSFTAAPAAIPAGQAPVFAQPVRPVVQASAIPQVSAAGTQAARAMPAGSFAAAAAAPAREETLEKITNKPATVASSIAEANEALADAEGEPELARETEETPSAPPPAAQAAPAANGATRADGITPEQVAEIKATIQSQQKFLGEIIAHGNRWELESAELRIYFPGDKRPFAEMMEGRDALEKIRAASSKVLGRAVRVCAKVDLAAAGSVRAASSTQELRAQFERDPMVRSMLQRFGGKISEVKWRQEES